MALFSQFDEESTQVSADTVQKELAKGPKRKGKQGNKLSQEEIDNLTAEELEQYILNEGNSRSKKGQDQDGQAANQDSDQSPQGENRKLNDIRAKARAKVAAQTDKKVE